MKVHRGRERKKKLIVFVHFSVSAKESVAVRDHPQQKELS